MTKIEPITPWERVEVIGDCTLYQGDCLRVMPFLDGVDAVVTDPPYGMEWKSAWRSSDTAHDAIKGDDDPNLLIWSAMLKPAHSSYIWMRWDCLSVLPRKPQSLITWVKNNHGCGDLRHEHGRQTEVCAFYPGVDHDFPGPRPNDVIRAPRSGNNFHPTEKPVPLMSAVLSWTRGTVCDPFMGSGTTGVACARDGRQFIGIEREPKYFDIACRRIEEAYRQPDMLVSAGA